jgi:hypothetical protein
MRFRCGVTHHSIYALFEGDNRRYWNQSGKEHEYISRCDWLKREKSKHVIIWLIFAHNDQACSGELLRALRVGARVTQVSRLSRG